MIPQVKYAEVISSGNMETNQASIEMTAEMFDLLSSGVYKDKIMAVIREIICNARDAHAASGNSNPIDVHVPTRFSPYFSVRDYGLGLAHKDIMALYLRYGYSNKRNSNDVIGGLGIGSKSPLAYTDSFLVTSYHDGMESIYTVFKENGKPQISKLSSSKSSKPSGIEVKVPVNNNDSMTFSNKFKKFAMFFGFPINCNEPVSIARDKATLENDSLIFYKHGMNHYSAGVYALMGGVVYQLSSELKSQLKIPLNHSSVIIFKFNIGDLSVAASRETLSEDKQTVENLNKMIEKVNTDFYKTVQDQAVALKSKYEYYEFLRDNGVINLLQSKANVDMFNYKGVNIKEIYESAKEHTYRYFSTSAPNKEQNRTLLEKTPTVRFIYNDNCKAIIKLCKHIVRTGMSREIILIDDQEDLDLVKWFYGDDVKVEKSSELYEKVFPKGAKSITVERSGIFDALGREVKTLEESDEGYYITFNNYTREVKQKDANDKFSLSGLSSFDDAVSMFKSIKELTGKDLNIFLCRKGGLKAIKKTKIKHITDQDLFNLIVSTIGKDKVEYLYYLTVNDKVGIWPQNQRDNFYLLEHLIKASILKEGYNETRKLSKVVKPDDKLLENYVKHSHPYDCGRALKNVLMVNGECYEELRLMKEEVAKFKQNYPLLDWKFRKLPDEEGLLHMQLYIKAVEMYNKKVKTQ